MRAGQTKRDSVIESCANVLVGFGVAIGAQKLIFPLFDMRISTVDNFKVAGLFTIVSLVRGYALRRMFNWWHVKKLLRNQSTQRDSLMSTLLTGSAAGATPIREARSSLELVKPQTKGSQP